MKITQINSSTPLVSVVIPAFNQAAFIFETVQSVIDQTYANLEIIVVNDCSTDNTTAEMKKFNDPRVKLIIHDRNKGLPAARNTGIRASSGELIALLDADDLFLPTKIQCHVNFFADNPDVGVSFNARFELNHSSISIREIWEPPSEVRLIDVILGFPFSPSDMVARREWLFRVGLFDESFVHGGEDTDLPCRLALEGCKFAGIDKVLNKRRYHSGRKRKNLSMRLEDVKRSLAQTFADERCPTEVLAIKDIALRHHLMVLVSLAFIQGETDLGHKFLHDLVLIDKTVIEGNPSELVEFLMFECIGDDAVDHEALFQNIANQLPDNYAWIANQFDWAIARGYLVKGIRAVMYERQREGYLFLEKAVTLGASFDRNYLQTVSHQLVLFEKEFGQVLTRDVIWEFVPYLRKLGKSKDIKWLWGNFYISLAFHEYYYREYFYVIVFVARGLFNDPSYFFNRGVIKILLSSLFNYWKAPQRPKKPISIPC